MATIRDRIIAYLQQHPEGVDDDELAEALDLSQRQQANSRCRQLEREGKVRRVKNPGYKIVNIWVGPESKVAAPTPPPAVEDRSWFWEGHVQDCVVQFLEEQGFNIQFTADIASRQTGKDIVAERQGKTLWVTVKGYPKGTARTRPQTQAKHWFTHAIFDIIVYRGESETAGLALALPDFSTYRNLAQKVTWFHRAANFTYLWVREDGTVTIESSRLPGT